MKIFVSYTLKDPHVTLEKLGRLQHELSKLGVVFVDILDNDSKDKQRRVILELKQCDLFILVYTEYSSQWMEYECAMARSLGKKMKTIKLM